MDPTFVRDEPGKSPMGMDLVPVYEDDAATGSAISIDPVTAQNMGLRLNPVERRDLAKTLRTVGLVGYEEPRQYSVNAKMDGWIEKLHVNETGAMVRRNQPLLEIYSPALVSAQEEFLLALDNRITLANSPYPEIAAGADRLLQASKRRLKLWDISDRQIDRLQDTRKVQKTLTLYAPYDGIVTLKNTTQGSYVKSGMELFQIADLSHVWIYADIYESELNLVRIGQPAEIILPFVDGKTLKGTVSTIYPYVEPQTRTVKARIDLENPGLQLKPDMYVNVRLKTDPVKNALAIPAEAVLNSGQVRSVFVSRGEGKFEPRRIETGLYSDDGYVEVRQGLRDDEAVVVSAQFMLDSESQLQEAILKMREVSKPLQSAGAKDLESLF
jgi:Cu(I)/Ag(I) efflux system membrane fusion protein/cobalt-zinc-cadmium efflux system membrane fusion protein